MSYVAVFIFTVLLLLVLRHFAPALGLVDVPGERKGHQGHIPLVGGLALFTTFLLSHLLLGAEDRLMDLVLMLSALLVLIGAVDDRWHLPHKFRLLAQAIIALLLVHFGDVRLDSFGAIVGSELSLGPLAIPITVFALVGVINAMNFIDGMDGLAGGLALITLLFLLYFALDAAPYLVPVITVLLLAIAAFLVFNARWLGRTQATIFLGDAGSLFLGFIIGWLLVDMSQAGASYSFRPVTALWIFAVPLIDTVGSMLRRILHGGSPFTPDRGHFHHILNRIGLSDSLSVVTAYAIAMAMGAVGVMGERFEWSEAWMFYSFLVIFGLYFAVTMYAWQFTRLVRYILPRFQ